jgi:hypothetical protein
VLAGGLVLLIGGALSMLYARQMQRDLTVVVLAVAGFLGAALLLTGFEPIGQVRAGTNLLPALKAAGAANPAIRVYSVGLYEQSLTFYLGRTVTLVDYTDEFAFGLEQQPELAIPTIPAFVARWRADAASGIRSLAIIRPEIAARLRSQGVPMRVVAEDARRTVIATQ